MISRQGKPPAQAVTRLRWPSTPANRRTTASSRNSIRSMPNANRARHSSEVKRTKGGPAWLTATTTVDSRAVIGRPALRRLLADIEDGQIDCVVVYKVDRLSRSLLTSPG